MMVEVFLLGLAIGIGIGYGLFGLAKMLVELFIEGEDNKRKIRIRR